MLVLKRIEGQWVDVVHAKTGDVLRIRVYDIEVDHRGRVNLAFDDAARNFTIQRPERLAPRPAARRSPPLRIPSHLTSPIPTPSREEVSIVP